MKRACGIRRPDPSAPALLLPVVTLAVLVAGCGGDAQSRELTDEGALQEIPVPHAEEAREEAPPPVRAFSKGTRLTFEMAEDISTSSHGAGDTFELRLVDEVRGSGGAILPVGTRARGVIMDARPSRDPSQEAVLAARIQSVHVNGTLRDLPGTVVSASTRASTGDSGARSAAKVATGAAAGAVIGQVLGGSTRSTVTGAAAGAAAGVGIALTTREGHATLHEGARVTVRLDRELVLP